MPVYPDLEPPQIPMSVRTSSSSTLECDYTYYISLSFRFECIYKISMVCYDFLIHKTMYSHVECVTIKYSFQLNWFWRDWKKKTSS